MGLREVRSRLHFCRASIAVPDAQRSAATLSGGESQHPARTADRLVDRGRAGILDEQITGLHQRDNEKLLATLRELRDLGNTLIVVEHDEDTMRAADYLIDIGPGAGVMRGSGLRRYAGGGRALRAPITRRYRPAKKIPCPRSAAPETVTRS